MTFETREAPEMVSFVESENNTEVLQYCAMALAKLARSRA
jgi:hypothetical protein